MKQGPHELAAMILDQAEKDHPSDPVERNVSVIEYMAMALVAAIELTCNVDTGQWARHALKGIEELLPWIMQTSFYGKGAT